MQKIFKILPYMTGSKPTCTKLIEEPKEPPDPPGKEDKENSPTLPYKWGSIPNYTFEKQIKHIKKLFTGGGVYSWNRRVKLVKNSLMKSHDS